jgi:hypothetical protein
MVDSSFNPKFKGLSPAAAAGTTGTLFTTLHFLSNLWNWPNKIVFHYTRLKRVARDRHSSLLDPFICCEENELLLI